VSRNEDIDNAIWSDPDFEALSEHATLLYLWSFTNPRCGMAGMYKVSHFRMTESKVPLEHVPGALADLAAAGFAFYEDSLLWVRTRVKYLRSRSPQMAKGVVNDLLKVPAEHPFRARFLEEYGSDKWLRDELKRAYADPTENLSEKPIGKPDSDTLSDTSTEVPGKGQGQGLGSSKDSPPPTESPSEITRKPGDPELVFGAWLESTGRTTQTVFSPERKRAITRALKSYPVADLLDAVDGWRFSAHHRGENESGTVYNDIELLLRDAKRIEKFRDLKRGAAHVAGHVAKDDHQAERRRRAASFQAEINKTEAA
jgi:hypothetical protein